MRGRLRNRGQPGHRTVADGGRHRLSAWPPRCASEITIVKGRVSSSRNFDRLSIRCASTRCPQIDVHIVPTGASADGRGRARRAADRPGRRERALPPDGPARAPAALRAARASGDADGMRPRALAILSAVAAVGCGSGARRAAGPGQTPGASRPERLRGHPGSRGALGRALRRGGQGAAASRAVSTAIPWAIGRRRAMAIRISRPSSAGPTASASPRCAARRVIRRRTSIRAACPGIPTGISRRRPWPGSGARSPRSAPR